MKILFVIPYLGNGGAERVVVNLANGLTELGAQVGVATFEDGREYESDLHPDVRLHSLRHRVKTLDEELRAIHFVTKVSAEYDTVISGLELRSDATVYACKRINDLLRRRKRYLALLHIALSQYHVYTARRQRAAFVRRVYPRFDAVIAVSHGVQDDLRAILTRPARIEAVYNPILLDTLQQRAAEPLPVELSEPFFLAVGRLGAQKDYPTMLHAYRRFLDTGPAGQELVILGRGDQEDALRTLARELHIADRVHLIGFQPNPWAFMRRATALVSSSVFEGCPQVLAEAMGCGTPIIATDCPHGPAELLENGTRGFLAPMRDHEALAAMMRHVVSAPEEAQKKAVLASAYARELDLSAISARYLEIIRQVHEQDYPHGVKE